MAVQQIAEIEGFKARAKATWMAGDYGRVAELTEATAEDFIARRHLRSGMRVLDVACGTGNLAIPAAKAGAAVTGIDIAPNLLDQARSRAAREGVNVDFEEGDAERCRTMPALSISLSACSERCSRRVQISLRESSSGFAAPAARSPWRIGRRLVSSGNFSGSPADTSPPSPGRPAHCNGATRPWSASVWPVRDPMSDDALDGPAHVSVPGGGTSNSTGFIMARPCLLSPLSRKTLRQDCGRTWRVSIRTMPRPTARRTSRPSIWRSSRREAEQMGSALDGRDKRQCA